jgi:hypothetical protein
MAKANRESKSSVFSNLFGKTEAFIELYSALLGVQLPPDIKTENVTLDQVLFMDQLNDLAYLVGDTVVILVEHQSTINPNMPLRFLMYASRVYEKMIENGAQYSQKLLMIPKPVFIVLYNGDAKYPEKKTLKLSDAFKDAGNLLPEKLKDQASLEIEVAVYNVNIDQNKELVARSRMLAGYVTFVGKCKEKIKAGMSRVDAIIEAIDECINGDILADYLKEHAYEVRNMLITEWDQEEAIKYSRAEAREEGVEEGIEIGRQEGIEEGIEKGIAQGIEKGKAEQKQEFAWKLLRRGTPIEDISEDTGLSMEDIRLMQAQFACAIAAKGEQADPRGSVFSVPIARFDIKSGAKCIPFLAHMW